MPFHHQITTRYGEVDQQGVVYNAHYLVYMDDTMETWMRQLPDLRETFGWDMMLKKATIEWQGSVTDQGQSGMPSKEGTYAWGGAFCTSFWVDPKEELVGVLMTQVRPYTHLNIRQDLQSLAYQAIVE